MLACLIDQQARRASLYAVICACLSLFGLMHSVVPSGEVYLPWKPETTQHYTIAFSYLALAAIFAMGKNPSKTRTGQ